MLGPIVVVDANGHILLSSLAPTATNASGCRAMSKPQRGGSWNE